MCHASIVPDLCRLEMPKDEMHGHNCIRHLRSVVQLQQGKIGELEKTAAEHKHQLAEQVRLLLLYVIMLNCASFFIFSCWKYSICNN